MKKAVFCNLQNVKGPFFDGGGGSLFYEGGGMFFTNALTSCNIFFLCSMVNFFPERQSNFSEHIFLKIWFKAEIFVLKICFQAEIY